MADPSLLLSSPNIELELNPSIGGAISNCTWIDGGNRVPLMRPSHSPLQNVLEAASFPLVPFVNRIRGGCFDFRGRTVRLAPNMAGDPSPLHGQGWTNAWTVESQSQGEAVLAFEHEAGEWPWSYRATQRFEVAANAIVLKITCRNLSDEPMPCGLGFHPYFCCGPDTRIQTHVEEVWTVDENVLPLERLPATGRYSLADDGVCGRGLDNGYGGWSGVALLTSPGWSFDLELSSKDARFFQLYSPEQGGIFVAEPVSHANAAMNEPESAWAALGLQVLQPGTDTDLSMRLEVRAKRDALG